MNEGTRTEPSRGITRVMGMPEERKERKKKTQKNIRRNNGRKLPEFDEKHYSTHP